MIGWKIRIVDFGVREVIVRSDPGAFDTDMDGLSDSVEFYETFTNATDKDTDNDGLEDYREAIDGHPWYDNGTLVYYYTNASAFDTDNDGLEDGEEVVDGFGRREDRPVRCGGAEHHRVAGHRGGRRRARSVHHPWQ